MGLKDFVNECSLVFAYLNDVWSALPNAIQLLMLFSFGGVLLIAVFRSIWR